MNRAERSLPRIHGPQIDMRWTEHAACADAPTALFFPAYAGRVDASTWRRLASYVRDLDEDYCHTCPVRLECLTHALNVPETDGIWAGTTPPQRQAHDGTPAQLLYAQEARR